MGIPKDELQNLANTLEGDKDLNSPRELSAEAEKELAIVEKTIREAHVDHVNPELKCILVILPSRHSPTGILMQREDVILEWIFLPRKPNKKLKTYIEKISNLIHKDQADLELTEIHLPLSPVMKLKVEADATEEEKRKRRKKKKGGGGEEGEGGGGEEEEEPVSWCFFLSQDEQHTYLSSVQGHLFTGDLSSQWGRTPQEKMIGNKETLYSIYFLCGKLATEQENALTSTADSMLSKTDKQDTKERTADPCQNKIGRPFRKSCFTDESVSYRGKNTDELGKPPCTDENEGGDCLAVSGNKKVEDEDKVLLHFVNMDMPTRPGILVQRQSKDVPPLEENMEEEDSRNRQTLEAQEITYEGDNAEKTPMHIHRTPSVVESQKRPLKGVTFSKEVIVVDLGNDYPTARSYAQKHSERK
ncbi:hypothetical protein STEG23_013408 [Scotinomys teguina]